MHRLTALALATAPLALTAGAIIAPAPAAAPDRLFQLTGELVEG